jgi:hypothetical protein
MVEPVTVAGNAAVTDRAVGRPVAWRMKNPLGLVERAPHCRSQDDRFGRRFLLATLRAVEELTARERFLSNVQG